MICYTDKPDWSKAFSGATHLIQLQGTFNYVFAFHCYGDFFSGVDSICSFNNFDVIESRPDKSEYSEALASSTLKPMVDHQAVHDMDVNHLYPEKVPNYKAKIEAQGIRKAVAHLKKTHGGDRYSSSAYLNFADELDGTNAVS